MIEKKEKEQREPKEKIRKKKTFDFKKYFFEKTFISNFIDIKEKYKNWIIFKELMFMFEFVIICGIVTILIVVFVSSKKEKQRIQKEDVLQRTTTNIKNFSFDGNYPLANGSFFDDLLNYKEAYYGNEIFSPKKLIPNFLTSLDFTNKKRSISSITGNIKNSYSIMPHIDYYKNNDIYTPETLPEWYSNSKISNDKPFFKFDNIKFLDNEQAQNFNFKFSEIEEGTKKDPINLTDKNIFPKDITFGSNNELFIPSCYHNPDSSLKIGWLGIEGYYSDLTVAKNYEPVQVTFENQNNATINQRMWFGMYKINQLNINYNYFNNNEKVTTKTTSKDKESTWNYVGNKNFYYSFLSFTPCYNPGTVGSMFMSKPNSSIFDSINSNIYDYHSTINQTPEKYDNVKGVSNLMILNILSELGGSINATYKKMRYFSNFIQLFDFNSTNINKLKQYNQNFILDDCMVSLSYTIENWNYTIDNWKEY